MHTPAQPKTPSSASVSDDVYAQIQAIDKALAHAQACVALNHLREALEQTLKAQALSHSLMFRLESERLAACPASLETAEPSLF